MKNVSTLFLKLVVVLIAAAVLAICIFGLPVIARDAAQAWPNFPVYTIIIVAYASALPFFFALYQALKILSLIDNNTAFSESSVKAIKNIKFCAILIGFFYGAVSPCFYIIADIDDAPGIMLINVIIISASIVVAVFAAVLEKLLKAAIDIKSENDLTV